MKIIINNTSMVPIYEQIMEQIKAQIISGQLKENDILPSVRTMAKELVLSMSLFILSMLISSSVLPSVPGVMLPGFAYIRW